MANSFRGFKFDVGDRVCLKDFVAHLDSVTVLIVVIRRYDDDGVGAAFSYYCRPLLRWSSLDDSRHVATASGLRLYHQHELVALPEGSWIDRPTEKAKGAAEVAGA